MPTTRQKVLDSLKRIGFAQISVVELGPNRFRLVGRVENQNEVAIVMASARTVSGAPSIINGLSTKSQTRSAKTLKNHGNTKRGTKLEASS